MIRIKFCWNFNGENYESIIQQARTEEFVQIIRKSRQGTINHQGEYYNVNEFQVQPKADLNSSSGIFIAGSSEEAIAIAARYGDCYVAYASDMKTTKQLFSRCKQLATECEREVKCGLLIDVIARETSEESWEAAQHMLSNFSRTDKMMKTILMKKIDSVGIAEHRRLMSYEQFRVDATLWSGISQISMAHALSIVGSYSEVIATIRRFQEIGANYFIFSGMANDREIERLGQFVLPYLI